MLSASTASQCVKCNMFTNKIHSLKLSYENQFIKILYKCLLFYKIIKLEIKLHLNNPINQKMLRYF